MNSLKLVSNINHSHKTCIQQIWFWYNGVTFPSNFMWHADFIIFSNVYLERRSIEFNFSFRKKKGKGIIVNLLQTLRSLILNDNVVFRVKVECGFAGDEAGWKPGRTHQKRTSGRGDKGSMSPPNAASTCHAGQARDFMASPFLVWHAQTFLDTLLLPKGILFLLSPIAIVAGSP